MNRPDHPPAGLRWTSRAYLVTGAGALFLVAAVAARDPVLVLVAVPLLIAPVAAALASPRPAPEGDLEWTASGTSPEVRITGRIHGTPPTTSDGFFPTFVRPWSLSETAPARVEWWPGEIRFELRWEAPRPVMDRVPPPLLYWKDPIGLTEISVQGRQSELVIERYPLDLMQLRSLRLERTSLLPGESITRRIGATGEFFGIRVADRDEPPRRINWMASARAGRWLANEFEVERTGELLILLDTRPSGLGTVADARFIGVARAAATGIAGAFIRQKMRIGFAAFGEFLDAIPLSTGRNQGLRIRRAILATWVSPTEGPAERCAVSVRRYYPPGLPVLLISSLRDDASIELVLHLRRRGFPVVVLSPAWRTLLSRSTRAPSRANAVAARLSALDRRTRLGAVRAHAGVVDWDDLSSLGVLARFLQQPVRRRL
jgi:uncharacterized protein (DUF58 family)